MLGKAITNGKKKQMEEIIMDNYSRIYVSPITQDNIQVKEDGKKYIIHKQQTVNFINVLDGAVESSSKPTNIQYNNYQDNSGLILLNYYEEKEKDKNGKLTDKVIRKPKNGLAIPGAGIDYTVDIFKQETDKPKKGEEEPNAITPLKLVGKNIDRYNFVDYNISNHRNYRYKVYLSKSGEVGSDQQTDNKVIGALKIYTSTHWQQWSITELHPVDNTYKNFTASPEDVWIFNLNVDTGEQTQNISRGEQQTLGRYSRYSQGKMNYVSGSVSCLLGSEVLPLRFILENNLMSNGGYTEFRRYASEITSNKRVDMLKAWRKLVYSNNPKLLKDREGQVFLVTINSSTNKVMDDVYTQPNTISFNWTEIGDADEITVLGK